MKWKAFIFVVLISSCFADDVSETPEDTKRVDEARVRAEQYIWNERDPVTGFWPHKEVTVAILGVAAELTSTHGLHNNFNRQNETEIIFRNLDRMHLDFFLELDKAGLRGLESVGDDVIAQIVSALTLTCAKDPEDYFGYDLINTIHERVAEIYLSRDWSLTKEDPPLHFPVMMLVLCNYKNYDLVIEHGSSILRLMSAQNYQPGKSYPMGVERAAFNAMALRCLQNKFNSVSAAQLKKSLLNYAIQNLKYLYSMQEEDGGYGTVYTTSLAIQADLSRLVAPPKSQPFRFKKARQWLMDTQKSDGSFGSSITFTSLAISGLTSRSVDHISKIDCHDQLKKTKDKFDINIEIMDNIFSKQTFVSRIPAEKGDILFYLLSKYAKENPTTLKLEQENDGFGLQITSINGLANEESAGYNWRAYRNSKELTIFDLSKEIVEEGATYIFQYS